MIGTPDAVGFTVVPSVVDGPGRANVLVVGGLLGVSNTGCLTCANQS
jgi:hypothetical protein